MSLAKACSEVARCVASVTASLRVKPAAAAAGFWASGPFQAAPRARRLALARSRPHLALLHPHGPRDLRRVGRRALVQQEELT